MKLLVKVTVAVEIETTATRQQVADAMNHLQYDTNFYVGSAAGNAIKELLFEQHDIHADFTGTDDVVSQVKKG